MTPLLRPRKTSEAIQQAFINPKRKQLAVNPDGGFFGTKDLPTALRRANSYDVIILPSGEYPGFTVKRPVEIRAEDGASVVIQGTIKLLADHVILGGLDIHAPADGPAISVEKGESLLRQCTVHGEINVTSQTRTVICMEECVAGRSTEGIVAGGHATLEIASTRISECRIGISLREGANCSLYGCRIETCQSADASNPGAGIFINKSSLYCEGVTLASNDVGAYLSESREAIFLFSYFHSNRRAAIIANGDSARTEPVLKLRSCAIERQEVTGCPQISLTGEAADLCHLRIEAGDMPALTADQSQLTFQSVRVGSRKDTALDLRECRITGDGIRANSLFAPALTAENCQGALRLGAFQGSPPTKLVNSPQLQLESCDLQENGDVDPSKEKEVARPSTIADLLDEMRISVRQNIVRTHLERLLRQAHATAQRKTAGLPAPEQSYHCAFTGPIGTGKLIAAKLLTKGLNAFGFVDSPEINELFPGLGGSSLKSVAQKNGAANHAAYFVRVRSQGDLPAPTAEPIESLVKENPQSLIILEGERDEVRRLVRSSPLLTRTFQDIIHFSTYGPPELTTLFSQFCQKDHIVMSPDTARTVLLAFHLYYDRKDKRFANAQGVEAMYRTARRHYLERCSIAGRSDLEMEPRDLGLPPDKVLRTASEGSPLFVTFCPSCTKENPWTTGLPESHSCLHCETTYQALWGVWMESGFYRHLNEVVSQGYDENAIARRLNFPQMAKVV